MGYIQPTEINFPLLRQICRKWVKRYSFVSKIFFYETIDSDKPYLLVVEHNGSLENSVQIEDSSIKGSFMTFFETICQIGLRITNSGEENEFLKCFHDNPSRESLYKWHVLSPQPFESGIKYVNYNYGDSPPKFISQKDFEKRILPESKTMLFPASLSPQIENYLTTVEHKTETNTSRNNEKLNTGSVQEQEIKREADIKSGRRPDQINIAKGTLDKAILKVSGEVELLYLGMKGLLKAGGITLSQASTGQQTEACEKFYNQNLNDFSILGQECVKGAIENSTYWSTSNPARDIKGGLFEQYITKNFSHLVADKNIKTNPQDLYSFSRKLKK